jgi:hypothetical protein
MWLLSWGMSDSKAERLPRPLQALDKSRGIGVKKNVWRRTESAPEKAKKRTLSCDEEDKTIMAGTRPAVIELAAWPLRA